MSRKLAYLLILVVGTSLILLGYLIGSDWGEGAQVSVVFYGVLVTIFLAAQLWGFVVSQINYVDRIERAKFELLEIEGIKCKRP